MSLFTSILGGVLGLGADKKQNKLAKEQLATDKRLADRQIQISQYIEQLAKEITGKGSDVYDPYGGYARYNPETKRYEYSLGGAQKDIQGASDREELMRAVEDQAIRRTGLKDFENMRQRSSLRADSALGDIDAARRGVNRIDPAALGGQLRADRTRSVNAGYDDAERAATKLQLRTGSSAVGDALAALARDRTRAQAEIGSPEVDALGMAEGINQSREDRDYNRYKLYGDEARGFYDAGYQPSTYDAQAYARLGDQQKFDLSKYDLGMGGSGQAASTIGDAAAGLRQGFQLYNQSRIHAPMSKFVTGLGNSMDSAGFDIMKLLSGMGG